MAKGRCSLKIFQSKVLFTVYLIALGWVVLTPANPNSNGIFGFIQISGILERFLNLFLLVPMTIFLMKIFPKKSPRAIFAVCLLTSLTIELIQLRIPGRVSDPIDVLTNSTGAASTLMYSKKMAAIN